MERKSYSYAEELVKQALYARKNAYAPYSHFSVGAALLTKSGNIYTGCNIENAAFGAGICAERAAVCAAVSQGEREFTALAIAAGDTPVSPCGICRQFLCEFGDFILLMASAKGDYTITTVEKLLPGAFTSFTSDNE